MKCSLNFRRQSLEEQVAVAKMDNICFKIIGTAMVLWKSKKISSQSFKIFGGIS